MIQTNYTWESDLSKLTDEQIDSAIEFKREEYGNIYNKYRELVEETIKSFLPSWKIDFFARDRFTIVRPGDTRRLGIDVYHGFNWFKNNEFTFEINPSCVGTFKINALTNEGEYYKAIGTILSDTSFMTTLHSQLLEFAEQNQGPYESLHVLQSERDGRARLTEINKKREELVKLTENIKPSFKDAKKLKNNSKTRLYTVIKKGVTSKDSNATYYGRPVKVVSAADVINPIYEEMCKHNQEAGISVYDMVEAHLIKFTL